MIARTSSQVGVQIECERNVEEHAVLELMLPPWGGGVKIFEDLRRYSLVREPFAPQISCRDAASSNIFKRLRTKYNLKSSQIVARTRTKKSTAHLH